MKFWKYLELGCLRPPEMICFDHLYSEYRSIKGRVKNEEAATFIEELAATTGTADDKKLPMETSPISWDDLFYFELILADYIPAEKLRSRIVRIRSDYKGMASEKEYAEYLGSLPPDLQNPPEPKDPPDGTPEHIEKLMRVDLKDLLGRVYMRYAVLPVRERRLTDLTLFAARLCLISLLILLGILLTIFIIQITAGVDRSLGLLKNLQIIMNSERLASLTIFVVVVTGAMGGFVSSLQRIQSSPNEGDSLYNLSLLFHGSKSLFVAPITGAIFAILLYMMFTAQLLTGTFFPTIYTPFLDGQETSQPGPKSNAAAPQGQAESNQTASENNAQPGSGDQSTAGRNGAAAKDADVSAKGLNVFDFLARSGPRRGRDYALLIIWCFIAGFAERFVPDTLDRLISNGKADGKK